jgi:hypothetical protein
VHSRARASRYAAWCSSLRGPEELTTTIRVLA